VVLGVLGVWGSGVGCFGMLAPPSPARTLQQFKIYRSRLRETRQDVDGSPTQSRTSPSVQRILRLRIISPCEFPDGGFWLVQGLGVWASLDFRVQDSGFGVHHLGLG
jgi:hypothetical protein